jgi:RND family efflux transporter MFP subunit
MGLIMAQGVAVANAILLVTFAERARRQPVPGRDAAAAAVEGAGGRLRPILMTALAMIAGMAPLALGWGEGGEQTAPLGRAVVGGLAAATLATLFVLPAIFALVMSAAGRRSASLDPFDPESSYYRPETGASTGGDGNGEGDRNGIGAGHEPQAVPVALRGLALLAALALALPAAGCSRPMAAKDGPAPAAASAPAPIAAKAEVVKPVRQALRRSVEAPGRLEPCEITPIHAKLSGFARQVAVDIGDKVAKGQVLTELWVPEVEADLRQKRALLEQAESRRAQAAAAVEVAQAGLATAVAHLAEEQAGIKKADAELARWQSELHRTERLVSERAVNAGVLDEARSRELAAEAARDEARAILHSAEAAQAEARAVLDRARADAVAADAGVDVALAEVRRAEALLGYARIEAPFDGVVTRRNVDTGHLTVEGPQGDPLFVVARTDVVTAVVGVPETFAAAVEPGDRVELRVQALGGRTLEGRVTRTAYVLDEATQTLRVEADLANRDGTLRPGFYVNARVIVDERPDVLTVPETALVREAGAAWCVVVAEGRAHRRGVSLGISDGTRTEVVSGLGADDVVVRVNTGSLVDDQAVAPVEPPAGAKP